MRRSSHSVVLPLLFFGSYQILACSSVPSPGPSETDDSGKAEFGNSVGGEMGLSSDDDLALGGTSVDQGEDPGSAGGTSEATGGVGDDSDDGSGGTTAFNSSGGRAGLANGAGGRPDLNAGGASTGEPGGGNTGDPGGSSSGVGGTEPGHEPASFAEIAHMIHQGCAGSVCHSGRRLPELTDDEGLHDRLLSYRVEDCGNAPLVDPGSPATSAILMVVSHQCGDLAMPDGCIEDPCVPQEGIDIISEWILAGASDQ